MKSPVSGTRRALGQLLMTARKRAQKGRELSLEEAAERAGVGFTWYRWLEEGRSIGLSMVTLTWVADALEIRGEARRTLFSTAGLVEEPILMPMVEPLRAPVRQLIETASPCPVYLLNRRGDSVAWNEATEAVYRCHLAPPARRNTYLFVFTQPEIRKLIVNWDAQARNHVRDLRAALESAPRDLILAELRGLLEHQPDFRTYWQAGTRGEATVKTKVFQHPRVGRLSFEVETLTVVGASGHQARFYVPMKRDGTHGKMERLLRRKRPVDPISRGAA